VGDLECSNISVRSCSDSVCRLFMLLLERWRSFLYEQLPQQSLLVLFGGWWVPKIAGAHHHRTFRANAELMNGNGRTDETNVEVPSEERTTFYQDRLRSGRWSRTALVKRRCPMEYCWYVLDLHDVIVVVNQGLTCIGVVGHVVVRWWVPRRSNFGDSWSIIASFG